MREPDSRPRGASSSRRRVRAAVAASILVVISCFGAVSCAGSTDDHAAASASSRTDSGSSTPAPERVLEGLRAAIETVAQGGASAACPLVAAPATLVHDLANATGARLDSVTSTNVFDDDDNRDRPACSFVVDERSKITAIAGIAEQTDSAGVQTKAESRSCRAIQVFRASTNFYIKFELFRVKGMTDSACRAVSTIGVRAVSSALAASP